MLDILGVLDSKVTESQREDWREWIWSQQICMSDPCLMI